MEIASDFLGTTPMGGHWGVPKQSDTSEKQKWRVIINYRKLNEISLGDSYLLPNITDILDKLGNSIYFITLDLLSGFHQIELNEKDISETAFNTLYGHYEFLRISFWTQESTRYLSTRNG